MAGKSNTSEMASLRVPLDVMAAAREAATADGQSWASWVVDSLRARLPGAAGEEGLIYFVRGGDAIKIGWTRDDASLKNRLAALQSGHPERLEIVRLLHAERWGEAWLHGFFAGARLTGEWFRFHEAMLEVELPSEKTFPPGKILDKTPVMSVRLDAELVASTKERAAADGIAWPEWLDKTLRAALVVKLPDTIAVTRGPEVRHEDPPQKRAKPIRLVADTPAPPRDRWTDGARCRQCGAMMRAGKCALGCK